MFLFWISVIFYIVFYFNRHYMNTQLNLISLFLGKKKPYKFICLLTISLIHCLSEQLASSGNYYYWWKVHDKIRLPSLPKNYIRYLFWKKKRIRYLFTLQMGTKNRHIIFFSVSQHYSLKTQDDACMSVDVDISYICQHT